jgi:hypothetical protein
LIWVSRTNRTRVPALESTYRNQMVKHEPKPHNLCVVVEESDNPVGDPRGREGTNRLAQCRCAALYAMREVRKADVTHQMWSTDLTSTAQRTVS